jgi:hypothetical protein
VVTAATTGGGRNGCRGERWAWISADVLINRNITFNNDAMQ